MGDMRETFDAMRDARRERRARLGLPCPKCVRLLPRASPAILLPGQRCKIHNYHDPRKQDHETD